MIFKSYILIFCLVKLCLVSSSNNRLMVWLCLEDCQDSSNQIDQQIQEIVDNKDLITAVSFEKYTLGANSALVINTNVTDVSLTISSIGVESWPMLTSYPHPDEFIDWMRE